MTLLTARRMATALIVLLLLTFALPSAFARGSFGGGGRAFGGGGFGRGFGGGGRSLFGGGRPAFSPPPRPFFSPAPRPAFTPAPRPFVPEPSVAPRPAFAPAPAASVPGGSFGRAGAAGSPASNRFQATTGTGGSFGGSGKAGSRTFSSIGSHPNAVPPLSSPGATRFSGSPYSAAYVHPYSYGGRPANAYFTGGYADYSFGRYGHPYYGWMPWSPVFYYNPPIYTNGYYASGGFSFARFVLGLVFWAVVIVVVVKLVNHFRAPQRR